MKPKFSLEKLDEAVAAAKQDEKIAKDTAEEVTNALVFSEAAQRQLEERLKGERRSLLDRIKSDMEAAEACLAKNRLHEVPTVRIRVWKALIGQMISGPLSIKTSKKDAEEIVSKLVSSGLLIQEPKGPLAILGKNYSISPDSLFEAEDMTDIKKKWSEFQERVKTAIKESASPRILDLIAGKKDVYQIFVPPQKYSKDGAQNWRPGGLLIIESDKGFIKPLYVIGGKTIEGVIDQIKTLDAKITARELSWETPPSIRFDPNDKVAKEKNSKTQAFWFMLKRGIWFASWVVRAQKKANLTGQEFVLEGKCGKYFYDYGEPWQETAPNGEVTFISRPAFLIERLEKEGQTFIQICEVPPHLVSWLSGCRECYLESEQFRGLPQPLKNLLVSMHRSMAKEEAKTLARVDEVLAPLKP